MRSFFTEEAQPIPTPLRAPAGGAALYILAHLFIIACKKLLKNL